MSITWKEPPADGKRKFFKVAEELKARPGEWAKVAHYSSQAIYRHFGGESWERRFVKAEHGHDVYVRFVGDK